MKDKHQSITKKNGNDSEDIKEEVLNLIEQYLEEKKEGKGYDEEVSIVIYSLLGGRQFYDYIEYYPPASVSVLRALTLTDVADRLKKEIGSFNFDTLCQMLERMVEFCWDLKGNQMFLAQLDQLMLGTSLPSCSDLLLKHYKNKYERLLDKNQESLS
jgi:hypothetical protein